MKSSLIPGLSDLAQAAYVNFGIVDPAGLAGEELSNRLEVANAEEWSATRRATFVENWRLVAHRPNTGQNFFSGPGFNGSKKVKYREGRIIGFREQAEAGAPAAEI